MKIRLMVKLLKYEIETLRFIDNIENSIRTMGFIGDIEAKNGAGMYEMYNLVLDKLGVPQDSNGYPGRDAYFDLYFKVWTSEDWYKNKNKKVKTLINDIVLELRKKK